MYPGGKGTCFQQIINLMPPHWHYVEPFLGGGSVFFNKYPAPFSNIVNDLDPEPAATAKAAERPKMPKHTLADPSFIFYSENALDLLRAPYCRLCSKTLIYCDPPYLMSARRSQRDVYAYEFGTEEDHQALIELLRSLDAMVILSGYWSELYADLLRDWNCKSFQVMMRDGVPAKEFVWYNFDEPERLHDYRYLGADFRDRERIRRKRKRWIAKLKALPPLEQAAILLDCKGVELGYL